MTREEAIAILKQGTMFNPTLENKDYPKAFDMAIKALEQEPCVDCVSRAELLKAIDTWDKFGIDDTNHLFRLDNLSLPHYVPYIHYDDVIKCIKGMSPVKPQEPKWNRLYNWLNDMRFGIAPDETVTDIDERNVRTAQVDLLDEIMEWMVEPQERSDKE